MDWQTLKATISNDRDYPQRTNELTALSAVVDGTQYSHLPFDFWTEEDSSGKYIDLDQRRPAVRTNLCKVTVDECGSLLFSDRRFPRIIAFGDAKESDRMQALVIAANLKEAMQECVLVGSVGSVALLVKFLSDRVFVEVMPTAYLTPTFDPVEPDKLMSVTERYKKKGSELKHILNVGKLVDSATYWYQRTWTDQAETIYVPQTATDVANKKPLVPASEVYHGLGFVPIVWIKNLPGGKGCDGACTFKNAIDTVIELDYLESQADRAMRYMGDPKLVIKGKFDASDEIKASAANAITIASDGDAKLLELQGGSAEAFDKRTKALRRAAMEAIHGNLADPDKVSAATSGRAMELLHQPQIWQADRLRVSYGTGLMRLLCMIGKGATLYTVMVADEKLAPFTDKGLSLAWGAWFDPTYGDIVSFTSGLQNATMAGIISEETATKVAAPVFGIVDVEAERKLIDADRAAADARLQRVEATVNASVQEPT